MLLVASTFNASVAVTVRLERLTFCEEIAISFALISLRVFKTERSTVPLSESTVRDPFSEVNVNEAS